MKRTYTKYPNSYIGASNHLDSEAFQYFNLEVLDTLPDNTPRYYGY